MNFFKNIFKQQKEKSLLDDFYNIKYKDVKTLLCGVGTSEIHDHYIEITDYPFEPSIAFHQKKITSKEIHAICVDFGTCSIEVVDDIIFISESQKDQLKDFAKRHDITLVKHRWNWDWILEPYLDTEFTVEEEKQITEKLLENSIDLKELKLIREEVGSQMYKYNFDTMLWDWNSLGLVDVLSAMRPKYNKKEYNIFYKKAIEINKRGSER